MTQNFVHLRLHSEFSIADGTTHIDDVVKAAANDGQGALALTDAANLFGAIKFYQASRNAGIKPILGCDVFITHPAERERPFKLLLLVQNQAGYLTLCDWLSRAWLTNQYRGRAELEAAWLQNTEGLIALSGAAEGEIGVAINNGKNVEAEKIAQRLAHSFPNRFYIEIQRAGFAGEENFVQASVALAARCKLPVVATHPTQFLREMDYTAHEARVCIAAGDLLANPRRVKKFTREQFFQTQAEMALRFADLPAALANTVEIAQRCNLELVLGKPRLPDFPTPAGITLDDFLQQQAEQGLALRLATLYPNLEERAQQLSTYLERLKFEIGTIIKMGFPGYFLIVADFIAWAKQNGVPVGPGRGSGAGSLVAYSLGITDLDPLAYNLLFERFLNPERVSMPDFDIDFCQEGRDRVIEYVRQRYGAECVSQIATFGTMAAKAAVRDVGRVLDLPYMFCDGIAKLIPFKPGKLVTIADAKKEEPQLAEREKNEDDVRELLQLAEALEGTTRNVGMHAGGVLIAPGKLTDFCPLYTQTAANAQGEQAGVISQFDKDDVEAVGLVKFDFLGLTTLTILNWAVRYIKLLDASQSEFNLDRVPLDDPLPYQLLREAKTVAVFQLESRGMQGMLKDARPDRFEDIIALVALYRPGPMDLIPDYCRRKHGEPFDYPDERVKPILQETYGIMVYQEQVMQMAQILGGYSLGAADLLRRAMGKKKAEEMAQQRENFRLGAAQNGLSAQRADEIFDLMEKFAGYGFNKSHAAAYALLAYHTAWLKAHHAAAFMAANLSCALDDTDKLKILIEDARDTCKLTILPPDVNLSDLRFTPTSATAIRYGLAALKGTGQAAVENILAARAEKPFSDLFDFCARVDRRIVNKRAIEALVRSGAFDALNPNRAQLFATIPIAVEAAEQAARAALQDNLFGGSNDADHAPIAHAACEPWPVQQILTEEKIALGLYLSGHLFDAYRTEARRFARNAIARLEARRDVQTVAGIITALRTQSTQRGKMVIVSLDDGSGQIDCTIYNEHYQPNSAWLKEDAFVLLNGKVSEDKFAGGLRMNAEKVMNWASARSHYARTLKLKLNGNADASKLTALLQPHVQTAGLPVTVEYERNGKLCEIILPEHLAIAPSEALTHGLANWLGSANVEILYA
jgi:DNA polymerase-3 subunit alpha